MVGHREKYKGLRTEVDDDMEECESHATIACVSIEGLWVHSSDQGRGKIHRALPLAMDASSLHVTGLRDGRQHMKDLLQNASGQKMANWRRSDLASTYYSTGHQSNSFSRKDLVKPIKSTLKAAYCCLNFPLEWTDFIPCRNVVGAKSILEKIRHNSGSFAVGIM